MEVLGGALAEAKTRRGQIVSRPGRAVWEAGAINLSASGRTHRVNAEQSIGARTRLGDIVNKTGQVNRAEALPLTTRRGIELVI